MTAELVISEHDQLGGLTDDDHVNYLLINGTRAMTGDLVMGDNQITGIDNLLFTDVNGEIAGIENQYLLDKTAVEIVSGIYTFTGYPIIQGAAPSLTFEEVGVNTWSFVADAKDFTIDATASDYIGGVYVGGRLYIDRLINLYPNMYNPATFGAAATCMEATFTINSTTLCSSFIINDSRTVNYAASSGLAYTSTIVCNFTINSLGAKGPWANAAAVLAQECVMYSNTTNAPPADMIAVDQRGEVHAYTNNVGTMDTMAAVRDIARPGAYSGATVTIDKWCLGLIPPSPLSPFGNLFANSGSTLIVTNRAGLWCENTEKAVGGGTETLVNQYGMYCGDFSTGDKNAGLWVNSVVGTGALNYGIYIGNVAGATADYGIVLHSDDDGGGAIWFGAGYDGKIYYNAVDLVIDSQVVGTGDVLFPNDNQALALGGGSGGDARIFYDGTVLSIITDLIAASDLDVDCGTEKTIRLVETVWDDINAGALTLQGPPGQQPDIEEIDDEGGSGTGIYTYGIAVGEAVSGVFEIAHWYKEGTDVEPHIHFSINAAPSGTDYVKFELTYTFTRFGETVDASTTISIEAAVDTQYEEYIFSFPTITGTSFKIGDQFQFTLERVAAAGDAFLGDILMKTFGLHCEKDTMGSRQEFIK